ncbi:uncharacterized protein LOC120921661 [Rana temporaria]|uniref:uncharacterized protein LOC120921661 n=1 Tax=Rana temporaria TaxID=8407 RepID=UPI001AAC9A4F|nr:uncharacterized protein LOC120921661 [Rana temporaria]
MANNRKHTGPICLLIVLGGLLQNTGAVVVQVKLVGSDVILKPQYSGVPSEITWRKEKDKERDKVVVMNLSPQEQPEFYILKDRATIDRTNGALNIRDLTIEDSGLYEADVTVNSTSQYTKINLIVYAVEVEEKSVGSDVVLKPKYSGELSEIIWRKGKHEVAHMKLSPQKNVTYSPLLEGRADIYSTNGVLTIKNLTIEDSGVYKAEVVLVDGTSQFTKINLNIRECSYPYTGIIALIVIVVVLAVINFLWCFYEKPCVVDFVRRVREHIPWCKANPPQ